MAQGKPRKLVLLQTTYVRWTKASRGAPGANARNRVPESLPLPGSPPSTPWPGILVEQRSADELSYLSPQAAPEVVPPPDPSDDRAPDLYLHYVYYDERNQFRDPIAQKWFALVSRLPDPFTLHFVEPYAHPNVPLLALAGVNDKVQVRFPWSHEVRVPPPNPRHLRERATLAAGQWLQLRCNMRIHPSGTLGYGGTWYYAKLVDNVGIVDAFVPTLFVGGPPNYQISELKDLR